LYKPPTEFHRDLPYPPYYSTSSLRTFLNNYNKKAFLAYSMRTILYALALMNNVNRHQLSFRIGRNDVICKSVKVKVVYYQ
jgi:hypothetical protein